MPVAQRVPIRRGNPSLKTSTGNLRPLKKTSTAAVVTRQEETNVKEQSDEVSSVLKKFVISYCSSLNELIFFYRLVDRFRFDEPKAPEKRQSFNSDIWWLRGMTIEFSSRLFHSNVDIQMKRKKLVERRETMRDIVDRIYRSILK